ncbi:MAG: carboxyl transferase domain-containing protein [Bacteroidales bacterium]|nr:carboxyl transferase domain-containing protein [Bacteroidales bacterium]MDT8431083.1 carboxyl transferase domain-containing protein [Bacteroidales bacterium]
MQPLKSQTEAGKSEFEARLRHHEGLLNEYRSVLSEVTKGGPEKARQKHTSRGKLLVRDRINLLLDPNTPFLELSSLAAFGQYENAFPSAGIVTGIGLIHGKETVIVANDATVKGGTYIEETIKKHLRAQEIALKNRIPAVYLVDSGGVFLPNQAEVFPDKDDFGRIFYNQARLSAEGIPQVAVVMGSCTAGGAYVPAMSDETIIVKEQGTIFLGGPPLVKAATGEDVTAEELGGGHVHTSISGVADHLAENDRDALQICRNIFETIQVPGRQKLDRTGPSEPLYDTRKIAGAIPVSSREPYDVREVIARLVDGSEFSEFKKNYGTTLVTGFARIMGYPVGIVANNGILFSDSSLKGTHFIELCDYRGLPIVFLQNISGFMVGKEYEHGGIAKDGAKMVHAVANTRVPRFTVIIGGSFGAGNYAMSGRAYDPNLLFMWPNAKISVMGGEQAADVLATIREDQMKAKGVEMTDAQKEEIRRPIIEKYEKEGSAYYSTSRIWDDGIIAPADTRKILGMAISVSLNAKFKEPRSGVYRM